MANESFRSIIDKLAPDKKRKVLDLLALSCKECAKVECRSEILTYTYNEFLKIKIPPEIENELLKTPTYQKFLAVSVSGFYEVDEYEKAIEIYDKIKNLEGIRDIFRWDLIDAACSCLMIKRYEESCELFKYLLTNKCEKGLEPDDYSVIFENLLIASYHYKGIESTKNIYKEILWHYGAANLPGEVLTQNGIPYLFKTEIISTRKLELEYSIEIFENMMELLEKDNDSNYNEIFEVYNDAISVFKIFKKKKGVMCLDKEWKFFLKCMEIANKNSDYAKVIEIYNEAKENNASDYTQIYTNLMIALNKNKKYDKVIELYSDIVSRNKNMVTRRLEEEKREREKAAKASFKKKNSRQVDNEAIQKIRKKYQNEKNRLKYNMQFFAEVMEACAAKHDYEQIVSVFNEANTFYSEISQIEDRKNKEQDDKLFNYITKCKEYATKCIENANKHNEMDMISQGGMYFEKDFQDLADIQNPLKQQRLSREAVDDEYNRVEAQQVFPNRMFEVPQLYNQIDFQRPRKPVRRRLPKQDTGINFLW